MLTCTKMPLYHPFNLLTLDAFVHIRILDFGFVYWPALLNHGTQVLFSVMAKADDISTIAKW